MRVVLIGPGYPPTLGGVETHTRQIATGLARRGVDVEAWVHDRGGRSEEVIDGVLVRRFQVTRSHRFPVSPALHRYARRSLHADPPDVVHAQSYHASAAPALLAAPAQTPTVLTPHFHGGGHTPLARLLHVPYGMVGRRLFARADAVVAVSAAEARLLPVPAQVIHNAADVAAIHAAAPLPGQPPTVLVVGRLERYKRVDAVVSAMAGLPDGQLVVIGDGPERERLTAIARSAGLSGVRFLGRVDDQDLHRWLRTSRVVVNLSEHEAFGIVALEAVAAGARAVLSDIPAHREVLSLLPPGTARLTDPTSLDSALRAALEQPNAGPADVRDWADAAAEHLELYEELVRRRAR